MTAALHRFIRSLLPPTFWFDGDLDTPLAQAEADREDWEPGELSDIPEPALSGSELVALRQIIEERFGDQTGTNRPAESPPDILADTDQTIIAVLQDHHAITYHAGIADVVEACECTPSINRDRNAWARHVLAELSARPCLPLAPIRTFSVSDQAAPSRTQPDAIDKSGE